TTFTIRPARRLHRHPVLTEVNGKKHESAEQGRSTKDVVGIRFRAHLQQALFLEWEWVLKLKAVQVQVQTVSS
ncbi:unnamed protein product, partial [Amoebophrya sp. A25]